MLRRQPTRVEDRADVAAEYEAYLQEKTRKSKTQANPHDQSARSSTPAAQLEARRQSARARIGLDPFGSS
ncbi:hypothetical protein BBJ28_00011250 [Nothophytophthora sp. Chile5]|nr:hypothetical protein BBJ28_00011250 [Nothophytophthora sp. Chile5]